MMILRILFFLGMLSQTSTLSYMADSTSLESESVVIKVVHSAHTRKKRSLSQLPDVLHFRFDLKDLTIQLNLTQSRREIESIPVYIGDERGTTLQENIPHDEDVAVFLDGSQGSVVIVKQLGLDDYHVAGNFHHGDRMYKVWPQPREIMKRSATAGSLNRHSVRPVRHFDLQSDTRVLPVRRGKQRQRRSADFDFSVSPIAQTLLKRHRRQTTSYVIEIGVFSDFSDYSFFLTEAGGDSTVALDNLRTYYTFVEESTQIRYNTVNSQDSSFSINVWIKYITAATNSANSPWTEDIRIGDRVDDDNSLNSFTDYIENVANNVENADHYMAFTRLDLEDNGNTDIAGIAFLGSLCTTSATSVMENTFDGFTASLAAHELGHSLNANHDSVEGCSDSDGNIMSTFLSLPSLPNPSSLWTFSSCSVSVFKAFLALPESTCASNTVISGGLSDGSITAGQALNADSQCARAVGTGSKFCRTSYQSGTLFDSMCQIMWCSNTEGNIDSCDGFIAHEGTSCGNGKWCQKGVCVSTASAPSRPANCPQGDDPTFGCQLASCGSYSASQLVLCCSTCSMAESDTMGPIDVVVSTEGPVITTTEEILTSTDIQLDTTVALDTTMAEITVPDTTTVAETTTVPDTTTVAETTTVADTTTVAELTTVADTTTVAETTTVADTTTVAETTTVPDTTTVAETTTVADTTTVAETTAVPETTSIAYPATTIAETAATQGSSDGSGDGPLNDGPDDISPSSPTVERFIRTSCSLPE